MEYDLNTLIEFGVWHFREGYKPSYTLGIISTASSIFALVTNQPNNTLVVAQLRKVLAKQAPRFPTMDIDEIDIDFDREFVQPFFRVLKEDLEALQDGQTDFASMPIKWMRRALLVLLRYYCPLRSSDVARIWRPGCREFTDGNERGIQFRILFGKCKHKVSAPIKIYCNCERDTQHTAHQYCLACCLRIYLFRTKDQGLCMHVYSQGDPCLGESCHDRSFVFMGLNRRNAQSFTCIKADTVASESTKVMAIAGLDTTRLKPHFLRALAARRLENVQGTLISKQVGQWTPDSSVYNAAYNPHRAVIVPVEFLNVQGEDEELIRAAD